MNRSILKLQRKIMAKIAFGAVIQCKAKMCILHTIVVTVIIVGSTL